MTKKPRLCSECGSATTYKEYGKYPKWYSDNKDGWLCRKCHNRPYLRSYRQAKAAARLKRYKQSSPTPFDNYLLHRTLELMSVPKVRLSVPKSQVFSAHRRRTSNKPKEPPKDKKAARIRRNEWRHALKEQRKKWIAEATKT